jgi:hypothetical protein
MGSNGVGEGLEVRGDCHMMVSSVGILLHRGRCRV